VTFLPGAGVEVLAEPVHGRDDDRIGHPRSAGHAVA
jgi:hypothetical protein